jgi:hypothetical protein
MVPLTDTQHRILAALSRPVGGGDRYATPATNQEIADEVFLSVDAVKAHLRTLYGKFGIEDLPQNQKRVRLVELVIEGGYVERAAVEEAPAAEEGAPLPGGEGAPRRSPRFWSLLAALAAVAGLVLAALAIAGVFSSDSSKTGVAGYKTAVRGFCELAISGSAPAAPGASPEERARGYLETIETMRGRLESLPPPAGADESLDRFRDGLENAADFTAIVAQRKPPAGSGAEANVVAELTFAAGLVQAGAVGYGLGGDCVAIGDVVARSARNAAAP